MTRLILPVAAAVCAAGMALDASATAAQPGRALSPDLMAIASWGQRVAAAQQPAADAFGHCQPVSKQLVAAVTAEDKTAARAVLPAFDRCVAEFEAASHQTAAALERVGVMPFALEKMLQVRWADLLARYTGTLAAEAGSLHDLRDGIDAAARGDMASARPLLVKARTGLVAAADTQVLTDEVLARGMPTATSRALMAMRLVTDRAVRAILIARITPEGAELGDAIHGLAPAARMAATQIRTSWASDSAEPRHALAQLHDVRRMEVLRQLDQGYRELSQRSDGIAAELEGAPTGTVSLVEVDRLADDITRFQLFIAQTGGRLAAAIHNQR